MIFFGRNKQKSEIPVQNQGKSLTLNIGDAKVEVFGDQYRKFETKNIFAKIGDQTFPVSLTKPTDYQVSQGWPKTPFVNVNKLGAKETSKENWLGYIPYEYGGDLDYESILSENDEVNAFAKIEKRGRDLEIVILVQPDLRITVQHDEQAQKAISILVAHGKRGINCELSEEIIESGRNRGKSHFAVNFHGHKIGDISAPKSAEIKNFVGENKFSARLSTRYFSEHPAYSTIRISRKSL